MEGLRQYVISVSAASLVCGIILSLLKKGSARSIAKLICGIYLGFTFLQPLKILPLLGDNFDFCQDYLMTDSVLHGEELARNAMSEIIKTRVETYIGDKAKALQLELSVEVILDEGKIPIPKYIEISGNTGPYARKRLMDDIETDLGIAKENIVWNS